MALSLAAILIPTWRDARGSTVAAIRGSIGKHRTPLWSRGYVDLVLLVLAAAFYWRSAASGYQVVLAPEGVAATAVDYTAFLPPCSYGAAWHCLQCGWSEPGYSAADRSSPGGCDLLPVLWRMSSPRPSDGKARG
ncbi:hypothetical protein A4U53_039225 (plasmid) [Rhizobium ruizarguesonis]|uniref:Uncharacterized protein n=1 Tax=Rhizobium ruizarguesonis TaxID=2081791 RepID=A0ACD5EWZ3_9HYPH